MTQEDKKLLLKDLCARLPYGLLVKTPDHFTPQVVEGINNELEVIVQKNLCYSLLYEVKPYLRPMSNMTPDEFEEFTNIVEHISIGKLQINIADPEAFDWLNARHFDYRGLIEKGLALEAPEGMYN